MVGNAKHKIDSFYVDAWAQVQIETLIICIDAVQDQHKIEWKK